MGRATAEATPPTIDINWPGWLEEFYQAYQAERIAADHADLSDDDALKTAARETLAQLNGAVAAIEGTPANSQEALAVKLAVAWNYHADELPFSADVTGSDFHTSDPSFASRHHTKRSFVSSLARL